jgi:hypothetical protein
MLSAASTSPHCRLADLHKGGSRGDRRPLCTHQNFTSVSYGEFEVGFESVMDRHKVPSAIDLRVGIPTQC